MKNVLASVSTASKRKLTAAARRSLAGRIALRWYREHVAGDRTDGYVLSFPKCGRTWLRLLLGKAVSLGLGIENGNLLDLKELTRAHPEVPKIAFSHDGRVGRRTPGELSRRKTDYRGKRVLLLIRDPRDVIVSIYLHRSKRDHLRGFDPYQDELSTYLRSERGSLDTLIAWYNIWASNTRVPADFTIIRYEDLQVDAVGELRRALSFLGFHAVGDGLVREAVEFASFQNMREMERTDALNSSRLQPGAAGDPESYKTRRGKVGGYVDYMSREDIEYTNERIAERLSDFYSFYR